MKIDLILITLLWVMPLVAALGVHFVGEAERARRVAIVASALVLALAGVVFFRDAADHAFARTEYSWAPVFFGIRYHVGVDGLSALLLPVTAGLVLAVLVAAPRLGFRASLARDILLTESLLLGVLVSLDALLLTVFWTLSLVPLLRSLSRSRAVGARAVFRITVLGSALPMALFVVGLVLTRATVGPTAETPFDLLALGQRVATDPLPDWLGILVLVGVLIRMGCVPFHLSMVALTGAPAPLVQCAYATPLGLFLLTRVAMPLFPTLCARAMPVLLPLGLLTAVYGAVLALAQSDLRRIVAYFWISQQGFLLTGISALNAPGVSGALLHAISAVVARTGLVLLVGAVLSRAGTADVRQLGGLVRTAPRMATGFLLLSTAAIGFPGTLGFVSEDLIAQGLLTSHLVAILIVLATTALNGIVLFWAFQRVFLGPLGRAVDGVVAFPDLLPRERLISVSLVGLLLIGGFAASPLLSIRQTVVDALHQIDDAATHHPH